MQPQVSISTQPPVYVAAILFVSFLAGALIIHARNQINPFDNSVLKSLGWARCARKLYLAALWAALGLITPMAAQFAAMLQARGNAADPHFVDTMFFIGFVTLIAETSAIVISIVLALNAAGSLIPSLNPGWPLPVQAPPHKASDTAE